MIDLPSLQSIRIGDVMDIANNFYHSSFTLNSIPNNNNNQF